MLIVFTVDLLNRRGPFAILNTAREEFEKVRELYQKGSVEKEDFEQAKLRYNSSIEMYGNCGGD